MWIPQHNEWRGPHCLEKIADPPFSLQSKKRFMTAASGTASRPASIRASPADEAFCAAWSTCTQPALLCTGPPIKPNHTISAPPREQRNGGAVSRAAERGGKIHFAIARTTCAARFFSSADRIAFFYSPTAFTPFSCVFAHPQCYDRGIQFLVKPSASSLTSPC